MKKTVLFYIALPALLTAGCARMDLDESTGKKVVFQAVVEAPVRSTASQDGRFAWSAGDRIGVQNSFGQFVGFDLADGAGTATATFAYENEGSTPFRAGNWAVFLPKARYDSYWNSSAQVQNDGTLTVELPYFYEWEEGLTNSPMVATIESGSGNQLSFKHLAGLIRCTVTSIPENASYFIFQADRRKLSGSFLVSNGIIETEEIDGDEKIVIYLDDVPRGGNVTFYIPVPVGDYEGITMGFGYYSDAFMGGGNTWRIDTPVHIDRADLREASHEFKLTWQEKDLGEFRYLFYEDSWAGDVWREEYLMFAPDLYSYDTGYQMSVIPLDTFNTVYDGDIGSLATAEDSPFCRVGYSGDTYDLELYYLDKGVKYVAFAATTDRYGLYTGDYAKAVFSLGWAYRQVSSSLPSDTFLIFAPEGKLAQTMTSAKESDYLSTTDATMVATVENDGGMVVLENPATGLFNFEGSWYTDPDKGDEWFYLCKIRMPDGRLLISRENSSQLFAVAGDSELTDAQLWETELQDDGSFLVKNYETSRYLQFNAQNGVFGLYDTRIGSLPFLLRPEGSGAFGIQNY